MKKKYIAFATLLIAATVYFALYHQNKTLKYVPKNTDILVLVDTKKLTRQYISEFLTHPSQWRQKRDRKVPASIPTTGLKIPDFIQVFHLKDTPISQWYSVFEIKDQQELFSYLKQQKFIRTRKNVFKKEFLFVMITEENCIAGTSDAAFQSIPGSVDSGKNDFQAGSFIDGSTGSISFISGTRTHNFSIDIHENDIEITNSLIPQNFNQVISGIENRITFLDAELDAENITHIERLFSTGITGTSGIQHVQAAAQLEQVNDTIITYGYDDNFNETEKKTVQKIVQPNYALALKSTDPEKTMQDFYNRKWINVQNQFTAIPFQPNIITKDKTGISIRSTRRPVSLPPELKASYIFVKNNPLLLATVKTLSPAERKMISGLEYIFYGNRNQDYYVKLQFKKDRVPLILRP
ncbi:hypothetical protein QE422_000550 [Chryseobacterium sp. SORGH_AS 447]|uniref:hypothetical protein n=1 Tax=Chryseobacterium sp. SORGH_AS_0447 TaxID=3041769 RepID=UPI0027829D70|nr:hypothetical protein [Chryseobacterium sp. SORGH_AS_0447]MDQ1160182.1 hypothetical protein [Chryseobacterium sp. SORGH_AS_0447]